MEEFITKIRDELTSLNRKEQKKFLHFFINAFKQLIEENDFLMLADKEIKILDNFKEGEEIIFEKKSCGRKIGDIARIQRINFSPAEIYVELIDKHNVSFTKTIEEIKKK